MMHAALLVLGLACVAAVLFGRATVPPELALVRGLLFGLALVVAALALIVAGLA